MFIIKMPLSFLRHINLSLDIICNMIGNDENFFSVKFFFQRGWSGGAMVLGKLPVPGRPATLDESRARAYCTCSRCGWGLVGHFYSHLSSFLSRCLWETT